MGEKSGTVGFEREKTASAAEELENRQTKIALFEDKYIAHRGLFNNDNRACPENSIPAFERARDNGYGIELDVRLTKDDKLVVFHDESLQRMCGINRDVIDMTLTELKKYYLLESREKIPEFTRVLNQVLINGKENPPLIIEVKARHKCIHTLKILFELLKDYRGIYCIESFNPLALVWLRIYHPEVIRGQLVMDYGRKRRRGRGRKCLEGVVHFFQSLFTNVLLLTIFTRPDFVAYNHKFANTWRYRRLRKSGEYVSAGWTIRSKEELKKSRKYFSIIIFDSFMP